MSTQDDPQGAGQAPVSEPALAVPEEFGRAMRQVHSGELTALSQRSTIRELRSAAGTIVKIDSPPR
jgi:hypothetical protein